MTRRLPTDQRREQIVLATLALLARHSAHEITTRMIAAEIGLTQPALFRHLASRAHIFEAVVAHSRTQLQLGAERVFASSRDWAETARGLAEVLLEHITLHPGLPRLFFHSLSTTAGHGTLQALVGIQAGLIADLVRQAQARSELDSCIDPDAAGRLFVVVVQGSIASSLTTDASPELARSAVQMWIAGVRAGVPAQRPGSAAPAAPERLMALDVRPLIAQGKEPLETIQHALSSLTEDGALLLAAPFQPSPLLTLLTGRGYRVRSVPLGPEHWEVLITGPTCPTVLDLRDLPAPEPMEAILSATASMADVLFARVPRIPRLLLPHLEQRGLSWVVLECADSTALLHVRRAL